MADERIEEIRRRVEAATPGPWRWDRYEELQQSFLGESCVRGELASDGRFVCTEGDIISGTGVYASEPDADFIARARTDVPYLLDRLEAAERSRERLRASMEYFVRYWWEHHQPDERDLEMARRRLDDPNIRLILDALADANRPDAGEGADGGGEEA